MELQICVLFTTLVVCGADIRPAGWLDKVVAHWKKSFVDDFEQLAPFNLEATIEPVPPGYQDSPDWDFDSVTRMLALLSVSETGQPALNSLRRMISPSRRMMMGVPGLAESYIPQSLYNNQNKRLGMKERRGMRYYRKRTGNNQGTRNQKGLAGNRKRMVGMRKGMAGNRKGMAGNRKGMAGNRMGMAGNRKGMAINRMGMAGNRKGMAGNRMGMAGSRKGIAYGRMAMQNKRGTISRKQMIVKKEKERELSDLQQSFRLFPSLKDKVLNNIYYDEERDDYEDASPEFTYVIESNNQMVEEPEEAIVLLRNPVEARLPSARISVRLLKEILEARAEAARVMPTMKTTQFTWVPVDINMTTPLTNDTTVDTTPADGAATGDVDDGGAATDGGATSPGGEGGEGGEAQTEPGAPADEAPPEEPEARKMVANHRTAKVIAKHH